jgi:hypothetical protein
MYDHLITTSVFNKMVTTELRLDGLYLKPYLEEDSEVNIEHNCIQIMRSVE